LAFGQGASSSAPDTLLVSALPYHEAVGMKTPELKALPHISVIIHNPHRNADEACSGVRLSDLLTKLGTH
jgi:hypothetical protein